MDNGNIKVQVRPKGLFYGWVVVGACYMALFTAIASYYAFGVFFKPISGEFGWTRAQTSLAVSINLMTGAFLGVLAGRLVDKYKPRNIMLICAALASFSYIMMSRINGLGQFYLLYGVTLGIAMSPNYIIPSVLINRWFMKKRGLALGIVFSAFGMAQMVSPPLVASLIESVGWRPMYIYIGIFLFIIISTSALFLRSSPEEMGLLPDGDAGIEPVKDNPAGQSKNGVMQGLSIKETIATSAFWLITLLWFFMAFPVYMMVIHLIPYTTDMGFNVIAAASIMTASGISSIVGRISLGHASDKFGNKKMLMLSFIMVILGMLLLIKARSLPAIYIAVIIFGFFSSGSDNIVIKAMADLFGLRSLGFIVGATGLAWRVGASSGAYLAGFFFDITSSYFIIFSLAAIAIYICFILTIVIFGKKPALKVQSLESGV